MIKNIKTEKQKKKKNDEPRYVFCMVYDRLYYPCASAEHTNDVFLNVMLHVLLFFICTQMERWLMHRTQRKLNYHIERLKFCIVAISVCLFLVRNSN